MQLTVQQAASFLDVPAGRVHDWIDGGEIPFSREQGRVHFNQTELLEWATARGIRAATPQAAAGERAPGLADALALGGVQAGVVAEGREAAIRAAVSLLPLGVAADPQMLIEVLLARESLGSTAVGDGIAIPHVRAPIVENGAAPAIALCALARPVDFGAANGKPVDTLFLLVSPTVSVHLQMLARLSAALHDPGFKSAVLGRAPKEELLAHARRLDAAGRALQQTARQG